MTLDVLLKSIKYDGTGLYSDILRHILAYDIQMQDMQGVRAGLCKHPLPSRNLT
jgi:hypothetical protein